MEFFNVLIRVPYIHMVYLNPNYTLSYFLKGGTQESRSSEWESCTCTHGISPRAIAAVMTHHLKGSGIIRV